MASADLRDELNCSICLDIYTDPVNLSCGHNFCQVCINHALDKQRGSGVYSCPECRSTYKKRPALQKNITLRNIAERFLSTRPEQEVTGIFCTYCIHSPKPAVKSCLLCEASLCEDHLRVHSKSPEHVLSDPTTALGNRKCSVHKKILEYYCAKDAVCICVSCTQDGTHHGHHVEKIDKASNKKKEKLRKTLVRLTSKREETEKKVQSLQEGLNDVEEKAACIIERVSALFGDIRKKLEVLEVQVLDDIAKQVEQNSCPISDLIQQLKIKKDELSSKVLYMEELCNMTDPLTVLQESDRGDFCNIKEGDPETAPDNAELDEILISLNLHKELADIVASVRKGLYAPEYSDILLDKETAANNVALSNDLKIAIGKETNSDIDDTDDSFESYQVLSRTSFCSGEHYWEVDICDSNAWRIGMSYNSIDREGNLSVFGNSDESWCLTRSQQSYSFRHDSNQIFLSATSPLNRFKRLGIYLDYEVGKLSFYNVGASVRLLHTYTATFTEPLHAAIRVGLGVSVKIIS